MEFAQLVKELGARQVSENLFEVPFNKISEQTFVTDDSEDFDFSNPRTMFESMHANPNGMDEDSMTFLTNSICQKGLLTPLIARYTNSKLTLINGHRRYLAIKSLIENNIQCFDNHRCIFVDAKELYKNVLVKIFNQANEIEAYILAFEEDKTKVKFGQGVEYKFVDYCINKNIPDDKIIQMTGNSSAWLDGVKSLLSKLSDDCPANPEILDAVYTGKMSIGAAKILADIENSDERIQEYKQATQEAEKEALHKKGKLEKQLKNNLKKQDTAKAKSTICETFGDQDGKKSADDILESFLAEEKEIKTKQQNISPVITAATLGSVNGNVGPRNGKTKKNKKEISNKNEADTAESGKNFKQLLVENWLQVLARIEEDKLGDMDVDSFVVDLTRDLVTSLINDQSCEEFLAYWSTEARMKFRLAE